MLLDGLKYKLGLKCGENIQNSADAPSYCHTTSPQAGLVRAVSLPDTPKASNMVVDTIQEHPKAEEMLIAWFKI